MITQYEIFKALHPGIVSGFFFMKYEQLSIDKVEYAIPRMFLTRIIDGVILSKIDSDSFNWNSPYGNCIIKAKMSLMIDLINDQRYEMIITALLNSGILKENLPIWKQ